MISTDNYVRVELPEIQDLMGFEGFNDNAELVSGSDCTYYINMDWLVRQGQAKPTTPVYILLKRTIFNYEEYTTVLLTTFDRSEAIRLLEKERNSEEIRFFLEDCPEDNIVDLDDYFEAYYDNIASDFVLLKVIESEVDTRFNH